VTTEQTRDLAPILLVVDDDAGLRETLADFFEIEGYVVDQASNIGEARLRLAHKPPDLILLDVNMPGGTGLQLAAEVRATASTPIIILSGKGDMVDRVVGLEVGADDYLAKPFELRELLARVRAVLRRSRTVVVHETVGDKSPDERIARFAGLVLNVTRRRLEAAAGEAIDVTGAEFNLLAAFVERANRVLSRDAIADLTRRDAWDAFDRSIDTLVSRLRRKLSPYTDATRLIQTVRSEGYVLAATVAWSGPPSA
jgi:DNA-binding response OmpR family regulator